MTRFFNTQSLLNLFVCGSLSLVSTSLLAATLKVSDNLIVSEINDKTIEHGFIDDKSVFELNRGAQAVLIRYKDVFEDLDFAEDRVVESDQFVVKFNLDNEQQLILTTSSIKNLASAQAFAKSPEIILKDEHNKSLNIELEKVEDYNFAKQIDIAVNTIAAKQSTNNLHQARVTNSTVTAPNKPTPAKVALVKKMATKQQTNNAYVQVDALTMLKFWWQNASEQEKKNFKQSILLKE